MRQHELMAGVSALLLSWSASCVQVDPGPDFDQTRQLIEESTGQSGIHDPLESGLSESAIRELSDDGLTLEEALELALVNNRGLRASFQGIGVMHADWVQSRLLSNPSLNILARFPSGGGKTTFEADMGFQLLELWRIPVREESARRELEAEVLRIARSAGELVADTRTAYFRAVAAQTSLAVERENVELARSSFDVASEMRDAGAADALDENLALGPLLSAQLSVRGAEVTAATALRDLAKVLSIGFPVEDVKLSTNLAMTVPEGMEPEDLVELASASRLDLRSFAIGIEALEARVELESRRAWGDVAGGVSFEQAPGAASILGPMLNLTLPIFDQNQAQLARAQFALQQARELYESAEIEVAQDVRSAFDRVGLAAENLDFYEDRFLPQARRSLNLSEESYTAGRTNLLTLIVAQQQLLQARKTHITLLLEAALAVAELERAVGVCLRLEGN